MLRIDTLKEAIKKEFPPDDKGLHEGRSEKAIMSLARELCGLPASKTLYNGGNRVRAYPGFRLVSDEEITEIQRSEEWCLTCGAPVDPAADPEHPLCDKHLS